MHFLNFLNFCPLNNSLELWIIFSWISLPKGIFWRNKKKLDFSWVSFDSRYSQKMALNKILSVLWLQTGNRKLVNFWIFNQKTLKILLCMSYPGYSSIFKRRYYLIMNLAQFSLNADKISMTWSRNASSKQRWFDTLSWKLLEDGFVYKK